MSDSSERREIITELAELAQHRIFEQRTYEFKISLAVWGALGAAVYGLAKDDMADTHRLLLLMITIGLGGAMVFACSYWLKKVSYIRFADEDRLEYQRLRREWENTTHPRGDIICQPSLGPVDKNGRISASPIEQAFVDFLNQKKFPHIHHKDV
jgi:hypothetical protein